MSLLSLISLSAAVSMFLLRPKWWKLSPRIRHGLLIVCVSAALWVVIASCIAERRIIRTGRTFGEGMIVQAKYGSSFAMALLILFLPIGWVVVWPFPLMRLIYKVKLPVLTAKPRPSAAQGPAQERTAVTMNVSTV